MAEETGKGAWMMGTTIDSDSKSSGWEKYWDPDATPMIEAEATRRYRELLEILFGPEPNAP